MRLEELVSTEGIKISVNLVEDSCVVFAIFYPTRADQQATPLSFTPMESLALHYVTSAISFLAGDREFEFVKPPKVESADRCDYGTSCALTGRNGHGQYRILSMYDGREDRIVTSIAMQVSFLTLKKEVYRESSSNASNATRRNYQSDNAGRAAI